LDSRKRDSLLLMVRWIKRMQLNTVLKK
jgi:hypothetical protein